MTFQQFNQFISDPSWDAPFFKRLANNDTHAARGHQGGAAIPKELQPFFPRLDLGRATALAPTVEHTLSFDVYIDGVFCGRTTGRYHFQTWRATRSPELRLTCLTPIYNASSGGDVLIFQRRKDSLEAYRALLLRKHTPAYHDVVKIIGSTRFESKKCWGSLLQDKTAMTQPDLITARKTLVTSAGERFVAIRDTIPRHLSSHNAIARDVAFRTLLLEQYDRKCAVSRIALVTECNAEVQAAHIIALAQGGPDDLRNGFTLTGTLHWAFDNGLFCVEDNRNVRVSPKALSFHGNEWLRQFDGKPISEASDVPFKVAPEAFAWHRENIFEG